MTLIPAPRTLAEWLRMGCSCFDIGQCWRDGYGGPCRLLGAPPARCGHAERLMNAEAEAVQALYRRALRAQMATGALDADGSTPAPAERVELAPAGEGLGASSRATGGRECSCGAPLPPHRKLCDRCRIEARRKTMRESQARWRLSVAAPDARKNAPGVGGNATAAIENDGVDI